jgi:hypothetical protein
LREVGEQASREENSKPEANKTRDALIQEATELMNILGAIVRKSE